MPVLAAVLAAVLVLAAIADGGVVHGSCCSTSTSISTSESDAALPARTIRCISTGGTATSCDAKRGGAVKPLPSPSPSLSALASSCGGGATPREAEANRRSAHPLDPDPSPSPSPGLCRPPAQLPVAVAALSPPSTSPPTCLRTSSNRQTKVRRPGRRILECLVCQLRGWNMEYANNQAISDSI